MWEEVAYTCLNLLSYHFNHVRKGVVQCELHGSRLLEAKVEDIHFRPMSIVTDVTVSHFLRENGRA